MTQNGLLKSIEEHGFACDSMLKGLTRWLRAGGYDAWWAYGIEDDVLIELTRKEGRVLLTSDSGLMRRPPVAGRAVPALYIPRQLSVGKQVEYVFNRFRLKRRAPRCMKCGGVLAWIPKAAVRREAPPRTYCWLDDFYRCLRCGQLFWKGTHWMNISGKLASFVPSNGRNGR